MCDNVEPKAGDFVTVDKGLIMSGYLLEINGDEASEEDYIAMDQEMCNLRCPLGGDETNDCADCFYAGDYHFVDGECIRREV